MRTIWYTGLTPRVDLLCGSYGNVQKPNGKGLKGPGLVPLGTNTKFAQSPSSDDNLSSIGGAFKSSLAV